MKDLTIHDKNHNGYSIYAKSPLLLRVLEKTERLIESYTSECSRSMVFRVDLRTPGCFSHEDYPVVFNDSLISRFVRSLDEKIKADIKRKRRDGKRSHDCELGYIWVKEFGVDDKEHYHVALFLNGDTYYLPGDYRGERDDVVV